MMQGVGIVVLMWCAGLLPFSVRSAAAGPQTSSSPPYIIFILADDLGWAELGCYRNTFNETPNLDRLASQGMRFTDAYAAASVCTPLRASFVTGQYSARVGLTDYLRGDDAKFLSPDRHVTIAEALSALGGSLHRHSISDFEMGNVGQRVSRWVTYHPSAAEFTQNPTLVLQWKVADHSDIIWRYYESQVFSENHGINISCGRNACLYRG